ncbi:MAG: carboxymuconolactone decarboxylase family protein [Chloroflexi bacterium]|nr:carboxymuconolactone decarboxylase family protein [Chloroflexota bacterium]
MARVPYAEEQDLPEEAELIARIKSERGGRLLNLYKMLLNSPPVASGWLHLLTAVRQQATLDARSRELAMTEVAILNGAEYEYRAHAPLAVMAGNTQQQIDALALWRESDLFDEKQQAVLGYTDSMTKDVQVPDEIFEPLRQHFNAREIVELTTTIAAYNMVSRCLEALHMDPEQPRQG